MDANLNTTPAGQTGNILPTTGTALPAKGSNVSAPAASTGLFRNRPVKDMRSTTGTSKETSDVTQPVLHDQSALKGEPKAPHKGTQIPSTLSGALAKEAAQVALAKKTKLQEGAAAAEKIVTTVPIDEKTKTVLIPMPKPPPRVSSGAASTPKAGEPPALPSTVKSEGPKTTAYLKDKDKFIKTIEKQKPDDGELPALEKTVKELKTSQASIEKWGDLYRMMSVYERRKDGVVFLNSLSKPPHNLDIVETLEAGKQFFKSDKEQWSQEIGETFSYFSNKLSSARQAEKSSEIPRTKVVPPRIPRRPT